MSLPITDLENALFARLAQNIPHRSLIIISPHEIWYHILMESFKYSA